MYYLFFFLFCLTAIQPQRFEFQSVQMGVPVRIVLYTDDAQKAQCAAKAAFETFRRLNAVMSDYDSDSELSQLSKKSGTISVSPDLFSVLKSAKYFSSLSDGAFDVTVGPYTRLWRRSRRMKELPKPVYLEQARKLVGNNLWELDEQAQSIYLKKAKMKFDLGGIAKGYAIDQAFEVIQQLDIESVLIDAGGDLRLGKAPVLGWTIQLANDTTIHGLENVALASSGDTVQFIEIDGTRYSHIIDPKTGLGLTMPSIVFVTAPTATEADALASALSILGHEKGIALIETQKNTAAKMIQYKDEKITVSQKWGITGLTESGSCETHSR